MKHDRMYMDIAYRVAEQSHSTRLHVGAVIVRDGNIISFGWNGTPPGFDNRCEENGETKPEVVHAELNALAKAARTAASTAGATIYLTHSPCWTCALGIVQSGITRVVYSDEYRDTKPLEMMRRAGLEVECEQGS